MSAGSARMWGRIADALADGQERTATEIADLAGYTVLPLRPALRDMEVAGLVVSQLPRRAPGQVGRPPLLWRLA